MRARRAIFAVLLIAALGAVALLTGLVDADRVLAFVRGQPTRSPEEAEALEEDGDAADEDAEATLAAGGRRPAPRTREDRGGEPTSATEPTERAAKEAAAGLEGTVLLADGRAARGARVTLIAPDGTTTSAVV